MVCVHQEKWKRPLLCVIEEYSSFGLQLSQSSCCCFQGSIEPQVDFLACPLEFTIPFCVCWKCPTFPYADPKSCLFPHQLVTAEAGTARQDVTLEWLLCKDHSLLRPSWKHAEAVSDLGDHISMLQVNTSVLSVYRTAAGTKYVCMF